MAIADAIALRFGGEKKVGRFPNPIELEEVKNISDCLRINSLKDSSITFRSDR